MRVTNRRHEIGDSPSELRGPGNARHSETNGNWIAPILRMIPRVPNRGHAVPVASPDTQKIGRYPPIPRRRTHSPRPRGDTARSTRRKGNGHAFARSITEGDYGAARAASAHTGDEDQAGMCGRTAVRVSLRSPSPVRMRTWITSPSRSIRPTRTLSSGRLLTEHGRELARRLESSRGTRTTGGELGYHPHSTQDANRSWAAAHLLDGGPLRRVRRCRRPGRNTHAQLVQLSGLGAEDALHDFPDLNSAAPEAAFKAREQMLQRLFTGAAIKTIETSQ
ncbi:hypothetical protein HDC34_001881 [Pseudoclavibacter sp. JAI123]|nr:hypothetical protein [Pseudoclavibacter sp. JAI123]